MLLTIDDNGLRKYLSKEFIVKNLEKFKEVSATTKSTYTASPGGLDINISHTNLTKLVASMMDFVGE